MTEKEKTEENTLPDIETKESERFLQCQLTEAETNQYGKEMARGLSGIKEKESALKSVKKQFESEIASIEGRVSALAQKVSSGTEMRNVKCEIVKNFKNLTVTITRLDGGHPEVIEDRTMRADEAQRELPFAEPEPELE